jgi:hypothetical protein
LIVQAVLSRIFIDVRHATQCISHTFSYFARLVRNGNRVCALARTHNRIVRSCH